MNRAGDFMSDLTRFSVSLDENLLKRFDRQLKRDGCPTRSKAIADLVRASLAEREWKAGKKLTGAVIMVYDHHKSGLSNSLIGIQHQYHHLIVSSQHVHMDHDNCLEIVVGKGSSTEVVKLARRLKALKGVKYASLATAVGSVLPREH